MPFCGFFSTNCYKFTILLFRIQIQKGGKVLLWNQVKSRMEACYSEEVLVFSLWLIQWKEQKTIFIDFISGHINTMNNYEQNSPSVHILTNVSKSRPVVSLKIYDQGDQSGTNACDPSPCQHLCLPKPQMDYTCHCTLGYILENEIECKEDTKSDKVCNIISVRLMNFKDGGSYRTTDAQ